MKKFKFLVFALVLVLSMALFVACDNEENNDDGDELELPEFSVDFEDGEDAITITQDDVTDLDLHDFSYESKGETSYFKAFKISELIEEIGLSDIASIESLLVVAKEFEDEEYSSSLPSENFENAYFALFYSETEDGEFEFLAEGKGPVRLYDLTEGTETKSVKEVARVEVNRA